MTDGLVVLLGWLQLLAMVALLLWFVLGRR
jgi:hypothetical protein